VALGLEQVFLELGQLAGAVEAVGIDQERRQHLGVSMLPSVHIEHEIDQGALQFRAHVPVQGEACAGDFGGAFEVENAELGSEIPVRLRLEVEARRLGEAPHLNVVLRRAAHRNGLMRDIGNSRE
jgi:hypothetical protein